MGQQQLLLLVLTVVLVGTATATGVDAFSENRRKFRQDQTAQLMLDLAARAQAWKATPSALGGGASGSARDFSAFTVEAVGLEAVSVDHRGKEVVVRTEYACLKVIPETKKLRINALRTDCGNETSWARVDVTGTGAGDLAFTMSTNGRNHRANGQ